MEWESYIRDQDAQVEFTTIDDEARAVVADALDQPPDSTWVRLDRCVFKQTECGASLYHSDEVPGRVVFSSIVEGIEQTTEAHTLEWPFTVAQVQEVIAKVEAEAGAIWDDTRSPGH